MEYLSLNILVSVFFFCQLHAVKISYNEDTEQAKNKNKKNINQQQIVEYNTAIK